MLIINGEKNMKNYINPEIKVFKFNDEFVATEGVTPEPTTSSPATTPAPETISIGDVEASVQGNVSFQKAIELR